MANGKWLTFFEKKGWPQSATLQILPLAGVTNVRFNFHLSFSIFHFSFRRNTRTPTSKWQMENDEWQMENG
jgi:hypothetical protein